MLLETEPWATLRSLTLASVLLHSDNRRIYSFTFGYAQISQGETSHIPQNVRRILRSFGMKHAKPHQKDTGNLNAKETFQR